MFVLLPPSETKAPGGQGAPLQLTRLSFPSLGSTRSRIIAAVQAASTDADLARVVLRLSARQDAELAANRALWHSPTTPALLRYTGVLYEGLDYPSLPLADQHRAHERLIVASAMFGAVRACDEIPAYRLSAGIRLPGLGSLRSVWRPVLTAALAGAPVLDLRSSVYQALGPVPDAITVRVVSPRPDGRLAIVSHHNKSYKGRLARAVCTADRLDGIEDVILAAKTAELDVLRTGDSELQLRTEAR